MSGQLVESLHEPFDAGKYHDEYSALVMKAIEAKAKGRKIRTQPSSDRAQQDD